MNKGLLLGDVHGSFSSIWYAYKKERPDYILQVGDLVKQEPEDKRRLDIGEYPVELPPVPFYWCLGNHEHLGKYKTVGNPLGHFGTTQLNGYKITGIGGIPGKTREIHWGVSGALTLLEDVHKTDILLSHEVCDGFVKKLKSGKKKDVGSSELGFHCSRIRPKLHVNGHHHVFRLWERDGIKHVSLGYSHDGYAIIEDWGVRLVRL